MPFKGMLITADDGFERRLTAVLAKCGKPGCVIRAHPIDAALAQLRGGRGVDVVILDRHTSGRIDAEICSLIARAVQDVVIVGLIREDVVLSMPDALLSRLDGTYYRNQVDRYLVSRLKALAARRRAAPGDERLRVEPARCSGEP